MAILLDEHTRVLVQGITGNIGRFHTAEMIRYGTAVVGGVTPGRGGSAVLGRPVFNTVKDAVTATRADASIVFVPPPFAADAIMEAADAGIRYCVCITDGIPTQDMMRVKRYMRRYRAADRMVLTGPNCAGTISPGRAMLGIMPGHIYRPGRVGIIGRSGTLGYEAAAKLDALGIGVSTSVGIGGDPINGSSFRDHLARSWSLSEDSSDMSTLFEGLGEDGMELLSRLRDDPQLGRRPLVTVCSERQDQALAGEAEREHVLAGGYRLRDGSRLTKSASS